MHGADSGVIHGETAPPERVFHEGWFLQITLAASVGRRPGTVGRGCRIGLSLCFRTRFVRLVAYAISDAAAYPDMQRRWNGKGGEI